MFRIIKQLIAAFLFLSPSLAFAQEIDSEIREFNAFDKIIVSTNISVHLIPSNEEKAIIEAKDLSNVITKQRGNKLRFYTRKPILKGEGVRVKLFYKKIRTVSANAGSTISSNKKLKGDKLYISTNTGGECILEIDADAVELSAGEGAIITIKGKCDQLEAKATTGAKIRAKELDSETLYASASFGAHIDVECSGLAELKALAGSVIDLYGNPKSFEYKSIMGGIVNDKTKKGKKSKSKDTVDV